MLSNLDEPEDNTKENFVLKLEGPIIGRLGLF